ncbi:hypothetical protein [Pseudomonas phage vB_Pa-PAC2]
MATVNQKNTSVNAQNTDANADPLAHRKVIGEKEKKAIARKMRVMRLKYFFAELKEKICSIRFTKHHLIHWRNTMWLNAAFFLRGLIGIMTFGLVELELTGKPSTYRAVSAAVLRENLERQLAETEAYKSGEQVLVGTSSSDSKRQTVADASEDELDDWLKHFSGRS